MEEWERVVGHASIDRKTKAVFLLGPNQQTLERLRSVLIQNQQDDSDTIASLTTTASSISTSSSSWIQHLSVVVFHQKDYVALGGFLQMVMDETYIPMVQIQLMVDRGQALTLYKHMSHLDTLISHFLMTTTTTTNMSRPKQTMMDKIGGFPDLCYVRLEDETKRQRKLVLSRFDEGNIPRNPVLVAAVEQHMKGAKARGGDVMQHEQKELNSFKEIFDKTMTNQHLQYISFYYRKPKVDTTLFNLYASTGKFKKLRVRVATCGQCPSLLDFLCSKTCNLERLELVLSSLSSSSSSRDTSDNTSIAILQALQENSSVLSLSLITTHVGVILPTLSDVLTNNHTIQELELSGNIRIDTEQVSQSLAKSNLCKLALYGENFPHWNLLKGVAASKIETLHLDCHCQDWNGYIEEEDDEEHDNNYITNNNNMMNDERQRQARRRRRGPAAFAQLIMAVLEHPLSRVRSLSLQLEYTRHEDPVDAMQLLVNSLQRLTINNCLDKLYISSESSFLMTCTKDWDHSPWSCIVKAIPDMKKLHTLGLPSSCACQELVHIVQRNTILLQDIDMQGHDDDDDNNKTQGHDNMTCIVGIRAQVLFHIRHGQVLKRLANDNTATTTSATTTSTRKGLYSFSFLIELLQQVQAEENHDPAAIVATSLVFVVVSQLLPNLMDKKKGSSL